MLMCLLCLLQKKRHKDKKDRHRDDDDRKSKRHKKDKDRERRRSTRDASVDPEAETPLANSPEANPDGAADEARGKSDGEV